MSLSRSIVIALASLAVAACAGLPETPEHMMASSGFKKMSATTPAQIASFHQLPQEQLVKQADKGKVLWVYRADPAVCTCVYVGDQAAYDTYEKKAARKPPIVDTLQAGGMGGFLEGDNTSPWVANPYE